MHYFGKIADDPNGEAALNLWREQKDDLLAGRKPRPKGSEAIDVKEVVNRFLTAKKHLLDSGEIGQRTFDEYEATGKLVADHFGRSRPVSDLRPDDFVSLRAAMAKRWGPVRLGNEIQRVRSIFKSAEEILDRPVQFGLQFRKPSAKVIRIAKAAQGPKDFSASELRAILEIASPNIKAMLLLGMNGGLGNTDLATMRMSILNLESTWLNYPRPKTGVPRRIPLWAETIAAIREVIANRKPPQDYMHADLLFISPRGHSYVVDHRTYGLTAEFTRTLKNAKIEGHSFYDIRRTFQTVADGCFDIVAVKSIMGHAASTNDMSAVYRQRVEDSRLLTVTNHVHKWLYADQTNSIKSAG
jgi:integrase